MLITIKIILIIAIFLTALITGLFYSYSCSVNPGLGRLKDAEYLSAMQSISRAIQNPLFFASFFGTLIMLPVSAWMVYRVEGASVGFYLILASAIVYAVGTFGVTALGNVPLNEALEKFSFQGAGTEEISRQRSLFETDWNRFHLIRTVCSLVSLLLVLSGVIFRVKAI